VEIGENDSGSYSFILQGFHLDMDRW